MRKKQTNAFSVGVGGVIGKVGVGERGGGEVGGVLGYGAIFPSLPVITCFRS